MKKKTCKYCKYYEDEKCHRFPPHTVVQEDIKEGGDIMWYDFPEVGEYYWCGEFKRKKRG